MGIDWIAFDYFSNSMNWSFLGFILGYVLGKFELHLLHYFKGSRRG